MNAQTLTRIIVCVLLATVAQVSQATNGYFLFGYGAKSNGGGGGGGSLPQDSLAVVNNPAGLVDVGHRTDVDLMFFNPHTRSSVGGFSDSSIEKQFLMPGFGMARPLDNNLSWGFALYGNGGFGSTFDENIFNEAIGAPLDPNDKVAIHITSLLFVPTLSWRYSDKIRLGAAPLFAYQSLSLRGLGAFQAFTPTFVNIGGLSNGLSNEGWDESWGVGLRVGWLGKVLPRTTLGASYSSKIKMQRFAQYEELLPEQGKFDIPASINLSAAFEATPKTTLILDVMRVYYEDVKAFSNPGVRSDFSLPGGLLGTDTGPGFGWHNQTVFKYGISHQYNQKWTLRAGYNYGKSQIPDRELLLNTISGATIEKHFMAGFTYRNQQGNEVSMSFIHVPRTVQKGPSALGEAKISAKQSAIGFAYSWL